MTDAGGLRGKSVALIGAGNMGLALLEGWAAQDLLGAVSIVEPQPSQRLQELCAAQGYALNGAAAPCDAVVLAVKPQALDAGAAAAAPFVAGGAVVVSILAGKRIADLAARLPTQAVVRAMPNTPASIGRGVTGAYASAATSAAQRGLSDALLSAVGGVEWVDDEALIDVVTAVSGSGPAYVFYFAECLAAAGAEAGLPAALAARLARATVEGAGELMRRQPETGPDELRRRVTSPGGTTAAALDVLEAPDGLAALMRRAVAAAKRRAGELSG
ncbi:pyrroline-5-carboxylate reductase [Sediminibacterium sp.]|uniref:pyrroline-5-carboxylate reductase n=1 Tax=Sediminibacterium sp. TaxID=1917865 RepID=UPI0027348F02|nr:pyrroline-5-carboxylate reductase [Sediminibacterium sp.]MDP3566457.1 pyrroline-5-carboxylate reductase [Sediminibacterium sp.]